MEHGTANNFQWGGIYRIFAPSLLRQIWYWWMTESRILQWIRPSGVEHAYYNCTLHGVRNIGWDDCVHEGGWIRGGRRTQVGNGDLTPSMTYYLEVWNFRWLARELECELWELTGPDTWPTCGQYPLVYLQELITDAYVLGDNPVSLCERNWSTIVFLWPQPGSCKSDHLVLRNELHKQFWKYDCMWRREFEVSMDRKVGDQNSHGSHFNNIWV